MFLGVMHLDLVVSHPIQPMVEEVVVPMQSSVDTPLPLGDDASLDLVISHLV